jgi:hypothetical protein
LKNGVAQNGRYIMCDIEKKLQDRFHLGKAVREGVGVEQLFVVPVALNQKRMKQKSQIFCFFSEITKKLTKTQSLFFPLI